MVVGQDLACLCTAAVGDEPSGRFGEEVNGKELGRGQGTLKEGRDAPGPCGGDLEGAKGAPRCNDSSEILSIVSMLSRFVNSESNLRRRCCTEL